MVDNVKTFGVRLRKALEMNCLNQEQLSKKLWIDRTTISRFVNGKRFPSLQTLNSMCNVLNVSSDYLLGRLGEDER